MKAVTTKGRNSAVKPTTNGVAKDTPPPVVGIDMAKFKLDMDKLRVVEFARFVQANEGKRVISVALTFDEFEAMSIAAGRHNGGDVAEYMKGSAKASCESDLDSLAHALRDRTAKIVETAELEDLTIEQLLKLAGEPTEALFDACLKADPKLTAEDLLIEAVTAWSNARGFCKKAS